MWSFFVLLEKTTFLFWSKNFPCSLLSLVVCEFDFAEHIYMYTAKYLLQYVFSIFHFFHLSFSRPSARFLSSISTWSYLLKNYVVNMFNNITSVDSVTSKLIEYDKCNCKACPKINARF